MVGLFWGGTSHGSTAQTTFRFDERLIRVKVTAPATGQVLSFLLDTGATQSIISLQAAKALALKLGTGRSVAGVHAESTAYEVDRTGLQFAGLPLQNAMLAMDLSGYNRMLHAPIDGLIGADFLRGKTLRIDYAARTITISDQRASNGAESLPIRVVSGALCVPVCVNGCAPRWTRLDTGCTQNLVWTQPGGSHRGTGTSVGLNGGGHGGGNCVTVNLGSRCVGNVEATIEARPLFGAEAGLLGNGILSRFIVEIDTRANRVALSQP